MAVIKCKMCGGDMEISPDKTFGTCEYCGSTMTLPKIDDEQRAARFNRGNHFRRIGEFDKALGIYEQIVQEDEMDAEAHWCCALCRFGIEYVEDPATMEYVPTCHRASFDTILEDVDYLAATEYSDGVAKRQYQKDASKIAEVQHSILATVQKEEPFDVFICYKESDEGGNRTVDSTLAQDIYYQLTDKGYRVFFARITLEDKVGQEYEPYIFAALQSAKVMLIIGTKPEYLNAVWVKNEWSRFLSIMKSDRKRLMIPCYRDMDPYDLPEQLSVLQSYDMSKIGFIQDLIRGVGKVLDAEKPKEIVKETVVVQNGGGTAGDAMLKRGNIALEDGEFKDAVTYYDKALDVNPESAEAYLGKALAMASVKSLKDYLAKLKDMSSSQYHSTTKNAITIDRARINSIVQESIVPGYISEDKALRLFEGFSGEYLSNQNAKIQTLNDVHVAFDRNTDLARAFRFAAGEFASQMTATKDGFFSDMENEVNAAKKQEEEKVKEIQQAYTDFIKRAEAQLKRMYDESIKQYRNRMASYIAKQEAAKTAEEFLKISKLFELLATDGDREAAERAEQCRRAAEKIAKEKADAVLAQKNKAYQKEQKENLIIRVVAIALCIIGIIIVFNTDFDSLPTWVQFIVVTMVFSGGYVGIKGIS